MKPRLVQWKNSWILMQAIVFCIALPVIAVLSHINHDSWGDKVALGGWVTLGMTAAAGLVIAILFYYKRWKWVSKWKYTTSHGVMCFFEPGTKLYLRKDVEDTTIEMYERWDKFLLDRNKPKASRKSLQGTICTFRPELVFNQKVLGYSDRLVYGISGWNWMVIGTGGKPIEDTAYIHECSHIHLNHWQGRSVPEAEAHEIFKSVKV